MAPSVQIRGYRELIRSLDKVNRAMAGELRKGLKEAAGPVTQAIQSKEVWPGASVSTIGPKVLTKSVTVTQRARKVTGQRGDYGALQMEQAFMPGLEEKQDEIEDEVLKAYDRLVRSAGFH